MTEDSALLRKYSREGAERSFAEFVERHLPLVFHTALRRVNGNTTLAEEATQNVFIAVAKKAEVLSGRLVLTGWLYASTRLAASDLLRREQRRLEREHKAFSMQQIDRTAEDPDWAEIAPVVHEILAELGEPDRSAILMRFFEGKRFSEIGRALHITEDGARLRVSRALDKLNGLLSSRGIRSTSVLVASMLAVQQVGAVPVGLAATISTTAVATAGAVTWATALHLLTMSKLKTGIVGVLVAAAFVTSLLEVRANRALTTELNDLHATTLVGGPAPSSSAPDGSDADARELSRLRRRSDQLQRRPSGVVDSAMKQVADCQNRGNATPEAAVESLFWAAKSGDLIALSRLCFTDEKWASFMDPWFATLSEPVRVKYGTPQRLMAAKNAGFLLTNGFSGQVTPEGPVITSYQVVDQRDSFDDHVVEIWSAVSGGIQKEWEGSGLILLRHDHEGWRYLNNDPSDFKGTRFGGKIDPMTGDWKATTYKR